LLRTAHVDGPDAGAAAASYRPGGTRSSLGTRCLLQPVKPYANSRLPPPDTKHCGAGGGSAGLSAAQVQNLEELRQLLVAAKEEQDSLRKERDQVGAPVLCTGL